MTHIVRDPRVGLRSQKSLENLEAAVEETRLHEGRPTIL